MFNPSKTPAENRGQFPATAGSCLVLDSYKNGFRHHNIEISPPSLSYMLSNLCVSDTIFDPRIFLSKLSALASYARIFSLQSNTSQALKWLLYSTFCLAIVRRPVYDPQCKSGYNYWLPETPGNCFGQYDGFVSSAVSRLIIDLIIVLLPLPMILKLQMNWPGRPWSLVYFL